RAAIVNQLNGLARSELGMSFNDLCASAESEDGPHALLAAMSLDTLPDHAPLPTGSRMPYSRNPLFAGRAGEVRAAAAALKAGDTAAIAAATGLGGIGKTQLAAEFVHRYGQFFAGGVFWMSFADANGAPAEVAACGGSIGMALFPDNAGLTLE